MSLKVDSASMHRTTLRAKDRVYARRLALARAVQRRKNVLFNDGDEAGPNKSESRQRAWEDVKLELVSKGFIEFAGKTRMDIRKTDWQHVRRYVMDKRKREAHTGIIEEPITEVSKFLFCDLLNFANFFHCAQCKYFAKFTHFLKIFFLFPKKTNFPEKLPFFKIF